MPLRADLRKFYGHHWRTVIRPRILERAGDRCERCHKLYWLRLEIAHLVIQPPDPGHDDDDNLAALCTACHHRHDYPEWARKCRLTRSARKDRARPLLAV